jgi:hypothetical protein
VQQLLTQSSHPQVLLLLLLQLIRMAMPRQAATMVRREQVRAVSSSRQLPMSRLLWQMRRRWRWRQGRSRQVMQSQP